MTTPESLDNTVLTLSPPRVPEATYPVIDADYGVPKHVYDLTPMGLKVLTDPPLAGTVNPGDVLALILNGQSVASKPINPGEENAVNTLYIPKGLLLTNRLNELVCTFTRGSQNIATSTPILTLLYNAIRPGIEDTTPGDGAHSELELILPPDVIEDGIDADRAKQGVRVCFFYPYCRAHDRIWLNCNGQDVYRTVTVAEAPTIPTAVPTTVCVMVDESVFERAGDSPTFVLSYTVHDRVGNGPDTDSPFSASYVVDVHLKETRLVAPDMAEAPGDPNDDPTTIDRDKLGQNDLTVLVHTFAPQWQPNDKIRVTFTATPASGTVVTHIVETDVARIPFVYPLKVPNAKVVAGSVARAKYELIRNEAVIATSKTATANIIGGDVVELLAPFLVKPAVSPIDVPANPKGVTVRVQHLTARLNDQAHLIIKNPSASDKTFPVQTFNQNKRANFTLTFELLLAWMSRNVELYWELIRNGKSIGTSSPLKLTIEPIADGDVRLGAPRIDQADSTLVVDINEFKGDATVSHTSWPFRGAEYLVDIRVIGTGTNGSAHIINVVTGGSLTLDEEIKGFSRPLSRSQLLLLKDSSTAHIEIKAHFKASSKTVIFPNSFIYTFKNLQPILSENFDAHYSRFISSNQSISIPSMNIRHLGGLGYLGINSINTILTGPYPPIHNQSAAQVLEMHTDAYGQGQYMRIEFRWGYSSVGFYYRFVQSDGILVRFLDKNGNSLSDQHLVNNPGPLPVFFSTSENSIWFIDIITSVWDLVTFDYFTMGRT